MVVGLHKTEYKRSNVMKNPREQRSRSKAAGGDEAVKESSRAMLPGKTGSSKILSQTHLLGGGDREGSEKAKRAQPTEECQ